MRIFFALLVLSLSFTFSIQAQDDADVTWYEGLFQSPGKNSTKEELRLANSRRADALKVGNKKAEVKALIELGVFHFAHMNDYENAMNWLVRSLVIEDSLSLNYEKVFTYLAMARVFEAVGNYDKSVDFLEQAANWNEKEKDQTVLALILNETGRVNAAHGKVDAALENFELALEYARKLGQLSREADALFYVAQLLSSKGNHEEALLKHKESLKIKRLLKDKRKEAISLTEIGEIYRQMKNEERALANHVAALEIRQSLKDKRGLAESYNNIGVLYFQQKDFKRAIFNIELALAAGREAQDQDQTRRSYDYLSYCYKERKDFKAALEYRELFLAMQELIQAEKNERHLLETQSRYVIVKKESEISKLETDREQREKIIAAQNKLRNFLVLLMMLGAIIALLIVFLYFLKRRSNYKLQELNNTKDKLFSIIGHDLKGPLNSLTSFSSLLLNHADMLSKEEIKTLSADLDKSLKNLLALLENLLEWSQSQSGNIDFKKEVFDITLTLTENVELLMGQAQNKKISIVNESKSNLMVNAHRHSINTVVRNLLSNAIKFTPENGIITLNVKQGEQLIVSVTDTGVGMSAVTIQKLFRLGTKHSTLGTSKEKGTGLGLILCKDFVEKNGGTINVESQEGRGSRFYFTVPID